MDYSHEGDRLLAEAGHNHLTEGAFSRQWRNTTVTPDVEAVIAEAATVRAHDGPEVTMTALMRGCTHRQREIGRLARLLHPRARRKQVALSRVVADHLGITPSAVYRTMARMYERMEHRYREITSREPSPEVQALWRAEQQHKRRQVYRRPARGWISAYRWNRKRWK